MQQVDAHGTGADRGRTHLIAMDFQEKCKDAEEVKILGRARAESEEPGDQGAEENECGQGSGADTERHSPGQGVEEPEEHPEKIELRSKEGMQERFLAPWNPDGFVEVADDEPVRQVVCDAEEDGFQPASVTQAPYCGGRKSYQEQRDEEIELAGVHRAPSENDYGRDGTAGYELFAQEPDLLQGIPRERVKDCEDKPREQEPRALLRMMYSR